jgi:hypothetical protein
MDISHIREFNLGKIFQSIGARKTAGHGRLIFYPPKCAGISNVFEE